MSEPSPNLHTVFATLADEGLIEADWPTRVAAVVATETAAQPWFIRVITGLGAWIASLMLFAAVAISGLATTWIFLLLGLLLIVGSVKFHRVSEHDLARQFALATSLTGQLSFIWGVFSLTKSIEMSMLTLAGLQVVLIIMFHDLIHCFLSVLFATGAVFMLLYHWEIRSLLPVLAVGLAGAFTWLQLNEATYNRRAEGKRIRSVAYGLLGASLGTVMLSTVYILPELISSDFTFYPHPWVSTVGFGVILLYLWHHLIIQPAGLSASRAWLIYLFMVFMIAASWPAPGVILSLVIILLGFGHAHRVLIGIGLAFFTVFVGAYFYGMEVTLLTKSMTLILTGVAILALRQVIAKVLPKDNGQVDHA